MPIIKVQAEVCVGMRLTRSIRKDNFGPPANVVVTAIGVKNILAINEDSRSDEHCISNAVVASKYKMNGYDPEYYNKK